jgi:hypothetical protein
MQRFLVRVVPWSTSTHLCFTEVIISEGKIIMRAIAKEAATIGTFAVLPIAHTPTITTLYALIETVQDQVAPEDDAAVNTTVARLCNAGYVTFLNVSEDREMSYTHLQK